MKSTEKYTIDWFIEFFSQIPEELWCEHYFQDGQLNGKDICCARGHLGVRYGSKVEADEKLNELTNSQIASINNGYHLQYQQPNPRARVLAALNDIKNDGKLKEKYG